MALFGSGVGFICAIVALLFFNASFLVALALWMGCGLCIMGACLLPAFWPQRALGGEKTTKTA